MVAFIDAHRGVYGVEPICAVLPIAPLTSYAHRARAADPSRCSARSQREARLPPEIQRVWAESPRRYGARTAWRQLPRDGIPVARCTVTRLFRAMGLQGVRRGRRVRTTIPDLAAHRPDDLEQRNCTATRPNQPWVADLTYVTTWQGFVYVAFVTDAFSRRIVGWRAPGERSGFCTRFATSHSECLLIEPSVSKEVLRRPIESTPYLAIRYIDRLHDVGMTSSVGSRGDAYDNALAETINGRYKTEVIHHLGPLKGLEDVEYAALEWLAWYNTQRLMRPLGDLPPAAFETQYQQTEVTPVAKGLNLPSLRETRGGSG